MKISELNADLCKLRVAIVHYWFLARTGGERVVESLAELFPQADLYCLFADRACFAPVLQHRKLTTSFLQKVPGATKFHRHFLPLQPLALEQFDLRDYDLVISSESGPAKGVITSGSTCHICYCLSPMRYIWDMHSEYQQNMGLLVRPVFSLIAHYMRMWDYASAARVDHFAAISRFVASRIRKVYRRESEVIYPPVNIVPSELSRETGDYYLGVGRLVDYKRFDLAVEACSKTGRKLRIVGDGPEYRALKRIAGPTVQFLGALSDEEVHEQLDSCRALLFPGQEDFGIVPVEAQSFGRPVIAYSTGGSLETVAGIFSVPEFSSEATGVFFRQQTVESLLHGIGVFERCEARFNRRHIRSHSLKFSAERFKREFSEYISRRYLEFQRHTTQADFAGAQFENSLVQGSAAGGEL